MIALVMLVAAISITSNITLVSTVPSMPVSSKLTAEQMHLNALPPDITERVSSNPILAIAMPKSAHKNGTDTVNIPETVKKPAMMPITMLARMAMPVQLTLQLHI